MTVATAQVRDKREREWLTGSPSSRAWISSTLVPSSQDSQAPPLETLIHGSWVESDILCVLLKIRRPSPSPDGSRSHVQQPGIEVGELTSS